MKENEKYYQTTVISPYELNTKNILKGLTATQKSHSRAKSVGRKESN